MTSMEELEPDFIISPPLTFVLLRYGFVFNEKGERKEERRLWSLAG